MAAFFCGDALCKAAVAAPSGSSWPVRCASCGTALYPADVLARLPPGELEPKRSELMTERAGVRVPVDSSAVAAAPAAPSAKADLDRLLEMVDIDPAATAERRKRRTAAIAAVAVVVLLLVGLYAASR